MDEEAPWDAEGLLPLPSPEQLRALRGPQDVLRPAKPKGKWKHRPEAKVEDRQWVPAALKHWRNVHGLTAHQAQQRIGYSVKGNQWARWEAGMAAPPYEALLRILAITGLGHWVDSERRAEFDPTLVHTLPKRGTV